MADEDKATPQPDEEVQPFLERRRSFGANDDAEKESSKCPSVPLVSTCRRPRLLVSSLMAVFMALILGHQCILWLLSGNSSSSHMDQAALTVETQYNYSFPPSIWGESMNPNILRHRIVHMCAPPNHRCILNVVEMSGMGSALLNLFAVKIYFEDSGGALGQRPYFILDESRYKYYRSEDGTKGVMAEFFTPQFPVIDTRDQYPLVDAALPEGQSLQNVKKPDSKDSQYFTSYTSETSLLLTRRHEVRKLYMSWLNHHYSTPAALRDRFAQAMCPNMRYNAATLARIAAVQSKYNLPRYSEIPTPTVAFHVRRSDKVTRGESLAYAGQDYVDKLVARVPAAQLQQITHCFVMTDDATTVPEVKVALEAVHIPCVVSHLEVDGMANVAKTELKPRSTYESAVVFLTEFRYLLEATYIVVTLGSNVGAMATVLRSCPNYGHAPDDFYHVYGVDTDSFYLE